MRKRKKNYFTLENLNKCKFCGNNNREVVKRKGKLVIICNKCKKVV